MITPEEYRKRLGRRIRELRSELGYSQESFADYCQRDRTYIGQIERGLRDLQLSTLMWLSERLGVTIPELLNGLDAKLPKRSKHK